MRIDFSKFEEPSSTSEAEDRIVALRADIDAINIQLDDANRNPAMTDRENIDWRKRAAEARRLKRAETGWLSNWINRKKGFAPESPQEVSAGGLLLATLPILNVAAEEGLVIGGDEAILEAVRGYVAGMFPSIGGFVTGTVALEELNDL
jgi:hypothetical protein